MHGGRTWELRPAFLRTSIARPRLGQPFQAQIDLLRGPAAPFVLALSLGRRPGLQVPGIDEMLPLAPDPLLGLSLSLPLATVLNASGQGQIPLRIPRLPGIEPPELFAAGFSLTGAGIGTITPAVGIQTVR